MHKWFGRFNGEVFEGEKFELHFSNGKSKYDTGKPSEGVFTPTGAWNAINNNGVRKVYRVGDEDYCVAKVRIRSVGNQKKCEFSGKFKIKQNDEWNLVI